MDKNFKQVVMLVRQLNTSRTVVSTDILRRIEEVTNAMLQGDFSKRIVADFDDDIITKIACNINALCDRQKLSHNAADVETEINTFIEVISSFANLDFKRKLPISDYGTIMDAIATGINMLGEELEQSTASKADLEIERNKLREAQSIAKVGSWEIDMQTLALSMSEECFRILGIDFKRNTHFLEIYSNYREKIHPDDLARVDRIMAEAIANAKPFIFECRVIVKGEVKTVSYISETVLNEMNEVHLLKGTIQDISERKRVETALTRAKKQAEQSNQSKSRFLANMSHEIRTPLNGILGLTDILSREPLSDEQRNYVNLIRHSGKNLAQLINDILDLSKIESGKLILESIPFPFRSTIESIVAPYTYLASQKKLSFYSHIESVIPDSVAGDTTRISQIIVNLLGNAIKFTETGSVSINFSLQNESSDSVTLKVDVKDTGVGIPKGKLEAVFESFSQADEAVSRKFGGTGLGLTIVRSLLTQMKGSITVDSTINEGTTFTFILPLRKIAFIHKEEMEYDNLRLSFGKLLKILVVDDNKVNLLVANKMLSKLGAEVVTAESAQQALDFSDQTAFDLIFMDIQMPEVNGYEATQILRHRGFTKPIVALSANAFREDVENSLAAGMNGHLQKPFTEKQLYDSVQQYIDLI